MFSSSAVAGAPAVRALTRNWWMWLIRGIAAIIFGILAFLWPGATWVAIAILFGAYALVDGIFAIVAAVRAAETHERWWPFLIEGIVGIVIAGITFYDVRITLLALYWTIAAWAFLTGIFEIVAAVQLRKHIANEFWLIIGGIASIVFGVLMIWFPAAGALAIIWLISAYAIVFGIIMIAFSLRLRSHAVSAANPATG
ncbi:MAG: HdeD family acid-resistance protein [Candidatus Eremiobacteraeota bacterium]|nr:HdeD family acid-resistance protein [Candidatus Eremiobacteraeota bacterium]